MTVSSGFPPVERADARILILGSLPGQRSIAAQQYYAHPQNAFWPIMRELFGAEGDYAERCALLTASGIALWDVLQSSVRPGSMDADIRLDSARANDFPDFFGAHASLRLVAFNGKKAEQLYASLVAPAGVADGLGHVLLPSTSPAYASLPFPDKLAAWRQALLGDTS
jgi:hypoxanthine-DNA glycosylase